MTLKARKSLNFLTPPFLRLPFGGNPLEFGDEIWRRKTRNHDASFLRFDTIPARDGQTDGRTR